MGTGYAIPNFPEVIAAVSLPITWAKFGDCLVCPTIVEIGDCVACPHFWSNSPALGPSSNSRIIKGGIRVNFRKSSFVLITYFAISAIAISASGAFGQSYAPERSLAPYVPTPQHVVDKMLELAEVSSEDVVYDLGCGDGRIVITAAKKYGAHGVGIDIDPQRIKESRANAQKAGVENLVTFKQEDAMKVDVSPATVVTLYLLSSSNVALRPILTKQLKPGARIVSHAFSMGDWPPLKTVKVGDDSGFTRTIYLWEADGKVRP
jgi:ribosomal protein L11 methylase PrmA